MNDDEMIYECVRLRKQEWIRLETGIMLLEDEVWSVVTAGHEKYNAHEKNGDWIFDVAHECIYKNERKKNLRDFVEYVTHKDDSTDDMHYTLRGEKNSWMFEVRDTDATYDPLVIDNDVVFKKIPDILTHENAKLVYESLKMLLRYSSYGKTLYAQKPLLMLPAPEKVLLLPEQASSK